MIIFKKIAWKNFLSYSNEETSLDLDSKDLSLIVGVNGSGKSVLVDVIFYALFGKAYRKVKLGELVNRINNKALIVALEFQNGQNHHKIIRGQKPGIFEIYTNDKLLDPQRIKDTQAYLEDNILKFDEKNFRQLCLMGSGYHVPFLKLPPADQRKIVEQLFDLDVISEMKIVTKEKIKIQTEKQKEQEVQESITEAKIGSAKAEVKRIQDYNKTQKEQVEEKTKELELKKERLIGELNQLKIEKSFDELCALKTDIDKRRIEEHTEARNIFEVLAQERTNIEIDIRESERKIIEKHSIEIKEIERTIDKKQTKITELEDLLAFYQTNNVCDRCGSDLTGDFIKQLSKEYGWNIDEFKKEMTAEKNALEKLQIKIQEDIDKNLTVKRKERSTIIDNIEKQKLLIAEIDRKYIVEKNKIEDETGKWHTANNTKQQITNLEEQLKQVGNIQLMDILEPEKILADNREALLKIREQLMKIKMLLMYLGTLEELLSDQGGVRSYIISKYLPVLNQKLLEYVSIFVCDYQIRFTRDFDIEILVRGENVNYENFSGGERQRIDLIILFTFMEFCKLKTSSATNLLIFDEVLDGSLDEQGVDVLFDILKSKTSNNNNSIYVISHRTSNYDRFENIYEIKKEQGFSNIRRL